MRSARCWPVPPRATANGQFSRSWNEVGAIDPNRPPTIILYASQTVQVNGRYQMKIDIVTLFPEICRAPLSESMMKRAQEKGIVELHIHNLRDWTTDKHHVVDDAPFGGGQGMVMKPEPIFAAVEDLKKTSNPPSPGYGVAGVQRPTLNAQSKIENQKSKIILMSPAGGRFDQEIASKLSQESHLLVDCDHYEGVDHRVI